MKTALVIAEKPKTTDTAADERNWRDFLFHIQRDVKHPEDTSHFSEGVWQMSLDRGLPALGQMMLQAQEDGIAMRVLFLEDGQAWIEYPPT